MDELEVLRERIAILENALASLACSIRTDNGETVGSMLLAGQEAHESDVESAAVREKVFQFAKALRGIIAASSIGTPPPAQ